MRMVFLPLDGVVDSSLTLCSRTLINPASELTRRLRFFRRNDGQQLHLGVAHFFQVPHQVARQLAMLGTVRYGNVCEVERVWIDAKQAAEIQAECDREASDAADWAEQQPDPVAEDALTNVFA